MATKYGFVFIESNVTGREKAITLDNNSEYYGVQSGSPSLVTITGRCARILKIRTALFLGHNPR